MGEEQVVLKHLIIETEMLSIDGEVRHPRPLDSRLAPSGPTAGLTVAEVGVAGDVGVDLGLQRDRQHPPCALPEQLVQVQAQLGLGSIFSDYTQHRGVPSSPALAA